MDGVCVSLKDSGVGLLCTECVLSVYSTSSSKIVAVQVCSGLGLLLPLSSEADLEGDHVMIFTLVCLPQPVHTYKSSPQSPRPIPRTVCTRLGLDFENESYLKKVKRLE